MDSEKKVGAGVGVMILKDGRVLLGKRHHDSQKADSTLHGEGTWTMPGGKIHFGESFEDAAYREVLEETGIKINKNNLKFVSLTNDSVKDAHFITIGLLCEDFEGEAEVREPDEITEWKWFKLNELPNPIYFVSEKILRNYFDGKFYRN